MVVPFLRLGAVLRGVATGLVDVPGAGQEINPWMRTCACIRGRGIQGVFLPVLVGSNPMTFTLLVENIVKHKLCGTIHRWHGNLMTRILRVNRI